MFRTVTPRPPSMDVSALVSQMHETLSSIHATLVALQDQTVAHDARLDELERQRDAAVQALLAAFAHESDDLTRKRQAERDAIAEQRRREDEERERRRRLEDEELASRDKNQDAERSQRLRGDTKGLEEEVEGKMVVVEDEAERAIEEGRVKLKELEDRRKEINRLIDEKMQAPLPPPPSRTRGGTRTGPRPIMVADSKPPAESSAAGVPGAHEQVYKIGVKAPEDILTREATSRAGKNGGEREVEQTNMARESATANDEVPTSDGRNGDGTQGAEADTRDEALQGDDLKSVSGLDGLVKGPEVTAARDDADSQDTPRDLDGGPGRDSPSAPVDDHGGPKSVHGHAVEIQPRNLDLEDTRDGRRDSPQDGVTVKEGSTEALEPGGDAPTKSRDLGSASETHLQHQAAPKVPAGVYHGEEGHPRQGDGAAKIRDLENEQKAAVEQDHIQEVDHDQTPPRDLKLDHAPALSEDTGERPEEVNPADQVSFEPRNLDLERSVEETQSGDEALGESDMVHNPVRKGDDDYGLQPRDLDAEHNEAGQAHNTRNVGPTEQSDGSGEPPSSAHQELVREHEQDEPESIGDRHGNDARERDRKSNKQSGLSQNLEAETHGREEEAEAEQISDSLLRNFDGTERVPQNPHHNEKATEEVPGATIGARAADLSRVESLTDDVGKVPADEEQGGVALATSSNEAAHHSVAPRTLDDKTTPEHDEPVALSPADPTPDRLEDHANFEPHDLNREPPARGSDPVGLGEEELAAFQPRNLDLETPAPVSQLKDEGLTGTSAARKSLFGSWGKSMRSLVGRPGSRESERSGEKEDSRSRSVSVHSLGREVRRERQMSGYSAVPDHDREELVSSGIGTRSDLSGTQERQDVEGSGPPQSSEENTAEDRGEWNMRAVAQDHDLRDQVLSTGNQDPTPEPADASTTGIEVGVDGSPDSDRARRMGLPELEEVKDEAGDKNLDLASRPETLHADPRDGGESEALNQGTPDPSVVVTLPSEPVHEQVPSSVADETPLPDTQHANELGSAEDEKVNEVEPVVQVVDDREQSLAVERPSHHETPSEAQFIGKTTGDSGLPATTDLAELDAQAHISEAPPVEHSLEQHTQGHTPDLPDREVIPNEVDRVGSEVQQGQEQEGIRESVLSPKPQVVSLPSLPQGDRMATTELPLPGSGRRWSVQLKSPTAIPGTMTHGADDSSQSTSPRSLGSGRTRSIGETLAGSPRASFDIGTQQLPTVQSIEQALIGEVMSLENETLDSMAEAAPRTVERHEAEPEQLAREVAREDRDDHEQAIVGIPKLGPSALDEVVGPVKRGEEDVSVSSVEMPPVHDAAVPSILSIATPMVLGIPDKEEAPVISTAMPDKAPDQFDSDKEELIPHQEPEPGPEQTPPPAVDGSDSGDHVSREPTAKEPSLVEEGSSAIQSLRMEGYADDASETTILDQHHAGEEHDLGYEAATASGDWIDPDQTVHHDLGVRKETALDGGLRDPDDLGGSDVLDDRSLHDAAMEESGPVPQSTAHGPSDGFAFVEAVSTEQDEPSRGVSQVNLDSPPPGIADNVLQQPGSFHARDLSKLSPVIAASGNDGTSLDGWIREESIEPRADDAGPSSFALADVTDDDTSIHHDMSSVSRETSGDHVDFPVTPTNKTFAIEGHSVNTAWWERPSPTKSRSSRLDEPSPLPGRAREAGENTGDRDLERSYTFGDPDASHDDSVHAATSVKEDTLPDLHEEEGYGTSIAMGHGVTHESVSSTDLSHASAKHRSDFKLSGAELGLVHSSADPFTVSELHDIGQVEAEAGSNHDMALEPPSHDETGTKHAVSAEAIHDPRTATEDNQRAGRDQQATAAKFPDHLPSQSVEHVPADGTVRPMMNNPAYEEFRATDPVAFSPQYASGIVYNQADVVYDSPVVAQPEQSYQEEHDDPLSRLTEPHHLEQFDQRGGPFAGEDMFSQHATPNESAPLFPRDINEPAKFGQGIDHVEPAEIVSDSEDSQEDVSMDLSNDTSEIHDMPNESQRHKGFAQMLPGDQHAPAGLPTTLSHNPFAEESPREAAFPETTVHSSGLPSLHDELHAEQHDDWCEGERDHYQTAGPGHDAVKYGPLGAQLGSHTDTDSGPHGIRAGVLAAQHRSHASTDSQSFVTPLTSAGLQSPVQFEEAYGSLADELAGHQQDDYQSASDNASSHYALDDEHTTTVHGADDLFDDDEPGGENMGGGNPEQDGEDSEYEVPSRDQDSAHESQGFLAQGDERRGHMPLDDAPLREQIMAAYQDDEDDEPKTAVPPVTPPRQSFQHEPGSNWADALERSFDIHRETMDTNKGTPQLLHAQAKETPKVSPFALRQGTPSTPGSASRGLASSRHNPCRPVTPPQQTTPAQPYEHDFDPDNFVPHDVTNVPWHARNDSIPQSMRSQSTLSSSPSSPLHASLPTDKHEPVIRDSWPAPPPGAVNPFQNLGMDGRPRNDSQLTDYDPFKYEPGGGGNPANAISIPWGKEASPAAVNPTAASLYSSSHDSNASNTGSVGSRASSGSPGTLFQRMRNIFESPQTHPNMNNLKGGESPPTPRSRPSTATSKPRSRPVSGVFIPVPSPPRNKLREGLSGIWSSSAGAKVAAARPGRDEERDDGYDAPGDRRGGFLNEAEAEIDERSALLRSGAGGLDVN